MTVHECPGPHPTHKAAAVAVLDHLRTHRDALTLEDTTRTHSLVITTGRPGENTDTPALTVSTYSAAWLSAWPTFVDHDGRPYRTGQNGATLPIRALLEDDPDTTADAVHALRAIIMRTARFQATS